MRTHNNLLIALIAAIVLLSIVLAANLFTNKSLGVLNLGTNNTLSGAAGADSAAQVAEWGNVARGKPASGSTACSNREAPEQAVNGTWDGGLYDKWCSSASNLWWHIDLNSSYTISQVIIYHAGAGGEQNNYNTRDFTIEVSTDDSTWQTVSRVTGNTLDSTTHVFAPVSARFVKVAITRPTSISDVAARLYEVQVYGYAGQEPPGGPNRVYAFTEQGLVNLNADFRTIGEYYLPAGDYILTATMTTHGGSSVNTCRFWAGSRVGPNLFMGALGAPGTRTLSTPVTLATDGAVSLQCTGSGVANSRSATALQVESTIYR